MQLVDQKRKLVENFGYIIRLEGNRWVAFDPIPYIDSFCHASPDYEATIEVAFLHVSAIIYDGLLTGVLTSEEAGRYFVGTSIPIPSHQ